MTKITLNDVVNLIDHTTSETTINHNNDTIEAVIENTLSRDGTAPNTMSAELDMNSNQIINLPAPATTTSPLRLSDLTAFTGGGTITNIPTAGTTGQVLGKNSNTNYDIGWKNSVTSVGLSLPAEFTVTGSPVTTTGTLTGAWVNTPTGTGGVVKATSPTLVTPVLGAATATTINKLTITAPATTATLAIPEGVVATGPAASGTLVTKTSTDTLTNKTFDTAGAGNALLLNSNSVTQGTWTITDQSGAGLAFTNVDAAYIKLGQIVIAYGQVTYPATASGSAARIGLPIAVLNSGRSSTEACVSSTFANGIHIQALGSTSNGKFKVATTGADATNANLTGQTLQFCLIYPAV